MRERCWRGGQGSDCGDLFLARIRSLNFIQREMGRRHSVIGFSLHRFPPGGFYAKLTEEPGRPGQRQRTPGER